MARSLQSAVELIGAARAEAVRRAAMRLLIELDMLAAAKLPPRLSRFVVQAIRVVERALNLPTTREDILEAVTS